MSNTACCGSIAHPKEYSECIFHSWGFLVEVGKGSSTNRHMLELSPNKIVKELLKNHQQDNKVAALLSRFSSFGQLYVN